MKLICSNKVINLDKFESVRYRESLWGDEYPVEAIRHETSGGLFGGVGTATEEIARFKHEAVAKALVKAITNSWIAGKQTFNVSKWILNKAAQYTPNDSKQPSPNQETAKRMVKVVEGIKRIEEQEVKQMQELAALSSRRNT